MEDSRSSLANPRRDDSQHQRNLVTVKGPDSPTKDSVVKGVELDRPVGSSVERSVQTDQVSLLHSLLTIAPASFFGVFLRSSVWLRRTGGPTSTWSERVRALFRSGWSSCAAAANSRWERACQAKEVENGDRKERRVTCWTKHH